MQPAGVFWGDEKDLALLVVEAFHNRRDELASVQQTTPNGSRKTYLLFPFVTQTHGFDTGIAISNTGADPLGTQGEPGVCKIHYYGAVDRSPAPPPQVSAVINPGTVCTFTLSQGNAERLLDNRGSNFSGYLFVECNFPFAHGYAFIYLLIRGHSESSGYLATVIKRDRNGE